MAEVNTGDSGGGKKGKHEKKRAKKSSTKIDMTPMVDLAFLLLTFFMLTTTFSKPQTMELTMPIKDKNVDSTKIKNSLALTVILSDHNKIYYYGGEFKDTTKLQLTDYSKDGIRKILLAKNKFVLDSISIITKEHDNKTISDAQFEKYKAKAQGSRDALFVLVKPDSLAKYGNVVDMLDELSICNVGKYALVSLFPQEKDKVKIFKKN
ncbi:MAG: biopolymer transporter ExbD [Bacteroidia bacterium]